MRKYTQSTIHVKISFSVVPYAMSRRPIKGRSKQMGTTRRLLHERSLNVPRNLRQSRLVSGWAWR